MPKGLFIGLGGTGIKTVARLKAILCQREYSSNKNLMYNDCDFIFYDTDYQARDEVMKDNRLTQMMGGNQIIDYARGEFIDAGDTSPYNLYKNALNASIGDENYQRLLDWVIAPNDVFSLSSKQLREGAGAVRMEGRTAIYTKADAFEQRIKASLSRMKQLLNQEGTLTAEDASIWVFGSSNGGTSSSALMDVLYLVDRIYKTNVTNDDPYLRLVLYMPKEFIDFNNKNTSVYSINAFATFWELNAFRYDFMNRENGGNKFGTFAVRPDKGEWKTCNPWPVYSYVMAVDTESQRSGKLTDKQMYDNTAELCYFLHTSAAGGTMVSALDNDLKNPLFKNNPKKATDSEFEWTRSIVGVGYKAITKADNYLKDYVKTRFRYDLYGYGLLGFDFPKVHNSEEERTKQIESFTQKYILKPLIDFGTFSKSDKRNTLFGRYLNKFETGTVLPSVEEIPDKSDWISMGDGFVNSCDVIYQQLEKTFIDPSKDYSFKWYVKEIEKELKEGIENAIVDYGLNYAYSLLAYADDNYCETVVMDKLKYKADLIKIKTEIDSIIKEQKPKKGIGTLREKLKEYRDASMTSLALSHIKTIIETITKRESGLLEYMRSGDQNSFTGIRGLITAFNYELGISRTDYQNLASIFGKTSGDVCSDYFPNVSDFVDGQTWVQNNDFEHLYASILPLDFGKKALTLDSNSDLGCPPVRKNADGKGLSAVLREIKTKTNEGSHLFFEMVMSNPQNTFPDMLTRFKKAIDEYLDDVFEDGSNLVNEWLSKDLPKVFDEYFNKISDREARQNYINGFAANIPVFYPTRSGETPNIQTRLLYVGATEDFAVQMGYNSGDRTMQYRGDSTIGNRFLVCKIEVGHNFYDYKYFPFVSTYYVAAKSEIEAMHSGCHIHRAFVKRDIRIAYENVISKRFDDFVRLCWFDSFFEFMNSHDRFKEIIEAIFGKEKTSEDWDTPSSSRKSPKKSPKKDEWDLDDDLDVSEELSDDYEDSSEFLDDDLDGTGFDGSDMSDLAQEEEEVELGYRSIVEIENNGEFVIRINKLKKSAAGFIGFSTEEPYEKSFRANTLYGIRKGIIQKFDLDYTKEFFELLSDKINGSETGLTRDMRQKLVKIHIKFQDYIFKVFKQKMIWFLRASKHKSDRADAKVMNKMQKTINSMKGKDIFK